MSDEDPGVFYEPPLTKEGWRDWRREIDLLIQERAKASQDGNGPPLDQQFLVILDNLLKALDRERTLLKNSYELSKRLTDERDHARRRICWMAWMERGGSPESHAKRFGWDCFDAGWVKRQEAMDRLSEIGEEISSER